MPYLLYEGPGIQHDEVIIVFRFVVRHFIIGAAILALLVGCSKDSDSEATYGGQDTAEDSVVIELAGIDSVSAFDLLRRDHEVDYRSTALGVFVTAVDSFETSRTAFWIYTVNDSMLDMAADKAITADGDRVKWHYRKAK